LWQIKEVARKILRGFPLKVVSTEGTGQGKNQANRAKLNPTNKNRRNREIQKKRGWGGDHFPRKKGGWIWEQKHKMTWSPEEKATGKRTKREKNP